MWKKGIIGSAPKSPKTGDNSTGDNSTLVLAFTLLSMTALAGVEVLRRKNNR